MAEGDTGLRRPSELAELMSKYQMYAIVKHDRREDKFTIQLYFFGDHIPFASVLGDTIASAEGQLLAAIKANVEVQ